MPYITQVAVGKRAELSVYGNDYPTPDGTGVRDYIHVVDLARGHVAALQYGKTGVGIFNLGTGVGYSVLDMVNTFSRVNGVPVPYRIVDRRPGDIATCYADSPLTPLASPPRSFTPSLSRRMVARWLYRLCLARI